jgi:hypothetical protein
LSGLAFYRRICDRHQTLQWFVTGAAVFITLAFLPQIFLLIFHCYPVTGLWPYDWQPESADYKCLAWGVVYLTNSSISLVSDLLLFIIPAALISVFRGKFIVKLKLTLVLFPGVL